MLAPLRSLLFNKALRELLNSQKRTRQVHTFDSARSVGLLFDATDATSRKESLEFARSLEKQGKKVRVLGYFNTKPGTESPDFDAFFVKETGWTGKPNSEKAEKFIREKFDLLLTLNPDEHRPLEWLAAASQAAFKIGFATHRPNDFDIQLETPEGKGIRYFTEQLALYLGKIVLK
ncbi:MAG: hypothetical protein SFV22_02150 [Saprospiraceae bacterium]|nr:hypothetical protein [Saprospiraceae bacterium]